MTRVYLQDTELTGGAGSNISIEDLRKHLAPYTDGDTEYLLSGYQDGYTYQYIFWAGPKKEFIHLPPGALFEYLPDDETDPNFGKCFLNMGHGFVDVTGLRSVSWNDIENKPTFSQVASTGSYDDLIDKPIVDLRNSMSFSSDTAYGQLEYEAVAITDERFSGYKFVSNINGLNDTLDSMSAALYDLENNAAGYQTATDVSDAINDKLSSVYKVKGSVETFALLPEDAEVGDVYNTLDKGMNYVYTDDGWDALGSTVDLDNYLTLEAETQIVTVDHFDQLPDNSPLASGYNNAYKALGIFRPNITNHNRQLLITEIEIDSLNHAPYVGSEEFFTCPHGNAIVVESNNPGGYDALDEVYCANAIDNLFDQTARAIRDLQSRISQTTSKQALSAASSSGMTVVTGQYLPTARRQGNMVTLEGAFRNTSERTVTSSGVVVATLPAAYRPSQDVYRIQRCGSVNAPRNYYLIIRTSGNVTIGAILDPSGANPFTLNASEAFYIGCSYFVDDDTSASTQEANEESI